MSTQTKERTTEQAAQPAETKGAVAIADDDLAGKPKLASALERRGVTADQFRVLTETIWPGAKSPNSIMLAIDYCRARNLDPMKRPVHIVPMWSTRQGKMVETIWPGIAETRTTAHRTGQYVGCSAPEWGPVIDKDFVGRDKQGNETTRVPVSFPEWCRITVKRRHPSGYIEEYTAEVWWEEAYATENRWSEIPNEMWQGRARGQLSKCAEAAALRMAFPEELGSDYTAEEMAGRVLNDVSGKPEDDAVDVPPAPKRSDFTQQAGPDRSGAEDVSTEEDGPAGGSDAHEEDPIDGPQSPASDGSESGTDEPNDASGADNATVQAYIRAVRQWDNVKGLNGWFNTTFQEEVKKFGLSEDQVATVAAARDAHMREMSKAPK
jgi:phage recombination protein Bet